MKVTVIVPVYNVEKYISRCLDSLISQTYKDIEIILVDDGTEDNSGMICDDYASRDSRIKVLHNENYGVSYSRNNGIDIANGEACMFVDSDDYIEPDTIINMVSDMQKSDTELVALNRYYINSASEQSVVDSAYHGIYKNDEVLELIRNKFSKDSSKIFFTGTWGKLYKTEILRKNKIYFPVGTAIGEDSIFVLNYMFNCKSVYCDDYIGYHYVKYEGSATAPIKVDSDKLFARCDKYLCELKKLLDRYSDRIDLCNEYAYDKIKCIRNVLQKEILSNNADKQNAIKKIAEKIDFSEFDSVKELKHFEKKMLSDLRRNRIKRIIRREKTAYSVKRKLKKIYRLIKK